VQNLFGMKCNSFHFERRALTKLTEIQQKPIGRERAGSYTESLICGTCAKLMGSELWQSLGPVTYLGMISYGLYVYHFPIYRLVVMRPIPATLITIAVASLFWHFYEKPLNSLKRYFNYPRLRAVGNQEMPNEIGDALLLFAPPGCEQAK
jgi:hypothetical protein